jgi:molecular chaperone GrpE
MTDKTKKSKKETEKKQTNESEIQKLETKCEEYLAGWQRAKADYENLKTQTEKEKQDFAKFANMNLIMGLIPVYTNFNLAFNSLSEEEKKNSWVTGFEHIKKQFAEVLEHNGVTEIIPEENEEFNPEVHEAVEGEAGENKIAKVLSHGYKINEKVFIPAKVVVK